MDYSIVIRGDFTKTISGKDFEEIQMLANKLNKELGIRINITQFSVDYQMERGTVRDNEKING